MGDALIDLGKLEALIAEAKSSGGSELANYQLFVERLCIALGLPQPAMAQEQNQLNDYVFERRVDFKHPDGSRTAGRIDCYRRGCFILEAKQSGKRQATKIDSAQMLLIPEDAMQRKHGQAKRGTRGWDQVMLAARKQAEDYSRALPVEHGYPPFLLVVDVGHVIEVYADFSGQGKNYAHFPDRQSFRIVMDDLRDSNVQARLKSIWTDPLSLDPTRISAEVTRDIAERLAKIAKGLEVKHDPKDVAEFLMRCLFTMFAEDVKLIPEKGFHKLLGQMKDTPEHFVAALESLWAVMDSGGYAPHLNSTLKKFNGSLFKKRSALPLDRDDINELWIAAGKDWSDVEPAIFGTLLERALDPRERSKLGAHYTPRTYVERLVVPTIIEPLRADWELVQGQVKELRDRGDHAGALLAVKAYHHILCTTRVLDPACGTGNFLYVSLELMKRLEGEVLEALDHLGEEQGRFTMEGETVNPRQFYGLELNPRAVPIADLVLWIGYLKWQLKTSGLGSITEPILHAYGTIKQQDAVITYDRQELLRDAVGRPLSRWDGVTKKVHPITGEEIPDPDAQVPLHRYVNPKKAPWPEAEFIVGNPPFIGTRRIRLRLGDGYVDALRAAYPEVVETADLVAYWWQEAAQRVANGQVRRFGLITTNSISQAYNRPVLSAWLDGQKPKLRLSFAVADHPWVDEEDGAAVRIAMTVGIRSTKVPEPAKIGFVVGEDANTLKIREVPHISSRLHAAASTSTVRPLLSNSNLCFQGVVPAGSGFKLNAIEAAKFPEQGLLKRYLIGRDVTQTDSQTRIIDAFQISLDELRVHYPATYQHLLERVLPEREQNARESYRRLWWVFAEPRPAMRASLASLNMFIGTPYTSKHRMFTLIEGGTLPDAMVYAIAVGSAAVLATLSGRVHVQWALTFGGTLEDRPRYNNTQTFDPFPFPPCFDPELSYSDPLFAQHEILKELGGRLVSFRKDRLSKHSFLTMTSLYNALERVRELENGCDVTPLSDAEHDVHQAGLISVLKEIHDNIDRAVLTAYGWEDLIPALVGKPGATLQSQHKTEAQERAEADLLTRLVALNHERAAEEKRGLVRWLRPDYQLPKLGIKVPKPEGEHVGVLDIELPDIAERPKWPTDGLEQIRLVRDLLAKAPAPTPPYRLANVFDGKSTPKRRERIEQVLETMVATGLARTSEYDGQKRYFSPR